MVKLQGSSCYYNFVIDYIKSLALQITSCVALGKVFQLLCHKFFICKIKAVLNSTHFIGLLRE